jgi:hypothetical protein
MEKMNLDRTLDDIVSELVRQRVERIMSLPYATEYEKRMHMSYASECVAGINLFDAISSEFEKYGYTVSTTSAIGGPNYKLHNADGTTWPTSKEERFFLINFGMGGSHPFAELTKCVSFHFMLTAGLLTYTRSTVVSPHTQQPVELPFYDHWMPNASPATISIPVKDLPKLLDRKFLSFLEPQLPYLDNLRKYLSQYSPEDRAKFGDVVKGLNASGYWGKEAAPHAVFSMRDLADPAWNEKFDAAYALIDQRSNQFTGKEDETI